MNIDQIRRLVIVAMCSDDLLMSKLVLKGGNALDLVHHLGGRASVDIDFSIEDDFEDLDDTRHRIEHALVDRFDSAGFKVFDLKFLLKPPKPSPDPRWGGYIA